MTDATEKPACSFCGKARADVKVLVDGPNVAICNLCVDLASDIVHHAVPPRPVVPDELSFASHVASHVTDLYAKSDAETKRVGLAVRTALRDGLSAAAIKAAFNVLVMQDNPSSDDAIRRAFVDLMAEVLR